ncbi:Tad domain-containing protein [Alcaligenaceae bacterium CGII-47]|nr:Tad domain-containing protein [Alcaligenaceae bacterium CGII-47]
MTRQTPFIKRLLRHQRGAVTPLFLLTMTAILGTTFGGIDLVRYNVVQSRLQNSLDAATLSAGRNLANLTIKPGEQKTQQWMEDAFAYFRSNMPADYLGNDVLPEDLTITYSEDPLATENYAAGQFINMEVKGTLPLISTGFLHMSSLDVHAQNRAVRRVPTDIELVMALDNTGSMGSEGKIGVLKDSASALATIVFAAKEGGDPDQPREINIGLVPFADTVNVGNNEYTRQWLQYPSVQENYINDPTHGWMGCIVEPPPSTWGGTNLPAAVLNPGAGFQPLHLSYQHMLTRKDLGLSNKDAKNGKPALYQRIGTPPRGLLTPEELGAFLLAPTDTDVQKYDRRVWAELAGSTNDKSNDDPAVYVYQAAHSDNCLDSRRSLFLNADLDTVQGAIDDMSAKGSTIIPAGLLWAWRMLHPAWQGAWDGTNRPRTTDPKKLRKVIVLLTDGKNEPSKSAGSSNNYAAYRLHYNVQTYDNKKFTGVPVITQETFTPNNGYTVASSRPSQGPMNALKMRDPRSLDGTANITNTAIGWGDTGQITNASTDKYLEVLCENVKTDGNDIKIYTVTLGTVGPSTEVRMNNCSSGAGFFYNAQTVSDLPDVFKSIAGALIELRLTL